MTFVSMICLITLCFSPIVAAVSRSAGFSAVSASGPRPDCLHRTVLFSIKQHSAASGLTLAELEAPACTGLTRLLPLNLTGVAGQETFGLEGGAVGLAVKIAQGAGDTEPDSLCLSFGTTADDVDSHIELAFGLGDGEGLVDDVLKGTLLEIVFKGTVVDGDVSFAGCELHASYGSFTSSKGVFLFHLLYLISSNLISLGFCAW